MPWVKVKPVIDTAIRGLCYQSYPLHAKGCPNFGRRPDCPPKAPVIYNVLDLSKDVYAIYNVYPFGQHISKMRQKHPEWSERQVRCCLYWQGTARKQLRQEVAECLKEHPDLYVVKCPEAQGVNLTKTMKNVDIVLEWPPETVAYQIMLAGNKKGYNYDK